ncbi:LPXTG cell wall anchor domain-containing protein [Natronoglycomyces albus]|uniref:LPXTG cell wall anchor domain-containing protein n=1 Tax=Natronoglycomyces albus TaxID=2811108 RepID=A0A895XFR3_9ACTN|nr:LPXTG cell wall anchor domain-containing protein [Natronoglycomyces albus]QSB04691.1 LPXTG cell wall anchor domain-containing protein [Natronoglycomyces albus]
MRKLLTYAAASGLAATTAIAGATAALAQFEYDVPDTQAGHFDVAALLHPKQDDGLVLTWGDNGLALEHNHHAADPENDGQVWMFSALGEAEAGVDLVGDEEFLEENGEVYDVGQFHGVDIQISRADGSCLVVDPDSYRDSGDTRPVPGRNRIADVIVEDCESTEHDTSWTLRFRQRGDGLDLLLHTSGTFDPAHANPAQPNPEGSASDAGILDEAAEALSTKDDDHDDQGRNGDSSEEVLLLGTERRAIEAGARVDVSDPSGWHNQVWRVLTFELPPQEVPPEEVPPQPKLPTTGSATIIGVSAGAALAATGAAFLWWRRRQQASATTTW